MEDDLSLDDMAQSVGLSTAHFARMFRKSTGETPHQFVTREHGAPLRLVAPVKLVLKNIKAITRITYTKDEPADYWVKRGYSRYDGI